MTANYFSSLSELISSPTGFVILILCFLIAVNKSSYTLWVSFGLCSFIVAVVAPPGVNTSLAFPFEEIRTFSRPISIFILGSFSIRSLIDKTKNLHRSKIPKSVFFLFLTLCTINIKLLIAGDFLFGLFNSVTILILFLLIRHMWAKLNSLLDIHLASMSIAVGGLLFMLSSLYQAIFDIQPLIFFNNQFVGMANNPQMTGLILALSLPSLLFLLESTFTPKSIRFIIPFMIIVLLYMIFLTGSRTAIVTLSISILGYYQNRSVKLIKFFFLLVVSGSITTLIFPEVNQFVTDLSVFDVSTDRFTNITDTRTQIWQNLWSSFLQYPLFGVPAGGERIGFGESTWLGAAASLGLLGLIPLLLFAKSCAQTLWDLNRNTLISKQSNLKPYLSLVNSSFAGMFTSSIAEAYLLGSLAFPIFAALIYILISGSLYEVTQQNPNIKFYSSVELSH